MTSTFPTPKEQANNLLDLVSNADHPLHEIALQTITVKEVIRLIELSERTLKV